MVESNDVEKRIKSLERRLARANKQIGDQDKKIDQLIEELNDMISSTGLLERSFIARAFTAWWYVTVISIAVGIVVRICVAVYF